MLLYGYLCVPTKYVPTHVSPRPCGRTVIDPVISCTAVVGMDVRGGSVFFYRHKENVCGVTRRVFLRRKKREQAEQASKLG